MYFIILACVSVAAGIATNIFLDSYWIGFFGVTITISVIYMYREYKAMKAADKKRQLKHKNKYL